MKTSVEIPDRLFSEARRLARKENRTLRALIEEGLRLVLARRRRPQEGFTLRKASFGGQGLQPHLAEAGWDEVRRQAYEGRGG